MTNRELAERQIDAANRFAVEELEEISSDDIVVDMSRSIGPGRGVYRGLDAAHRFLMSYSEAFESVIATPLDFYERGNWMAVDVRVRVRGRGSGVDVDARGARVYEFREGKIARFVQFQNMADAHEFVDAQA
jgi:ketosteroid isomerase-like protein